MLLLLLICICIFAAWAWYLGMYGFLNNSLTKAHPDLWKSLIVVAYLNSLGPEGSAVVLHAHIAYSCLFKCICPIKAVMFVQSCWSVFRIYKHSGKLNAKVQSFKTFSEKCSERKKNWLLWKTVAQLFVTTQLFMKFVIRSLFRANSSNSKCTWSFRGSAAFCINVLYVQNGLQ